MKKIIALSLIVATLLLTILFTPVVHAAGGADSNPYGPYGKTHRPVDTGGSMNTIVLASIASYAFGTVVYASAKVLENRQRA